MSPRAKSIGESVVMKMSEPFYQTGRVITADNYFISIPLAQNLWRNGLMLVGTLRKKKTEIPPEFLPSKNREIFSSIYGFNNYLTLVSYVPKKNKSVLYMSLFSYIKVFILISYCYIIGNTFNN